MASANRRFTLLDATVLIAATAAGLAVMRTLAGCQELIRIGTLYQPPGISEAALYRIRTLAFWPAPFLTCWTLALVTLSRRGPRPTFRRIARRPGMAVGLALVLSLIKNVVSYGKHFIQALHAASPTSERGVNWWYFFWTDVAVWTGLFVLVTWSTLALSGRWSARADWHDRLGRILGTCWILIALTWYVDDLWTSRFGL